MQRREFLRFTLAVGLDVFLLGGCGRGLKPGVNERPHLKSGSAVTAVRNSTRKVLVGIDITGSYALIHQALPLAAEFFVANAQPGDTWTFRWIERESYSDRAAIPVLNGKSSVTLPLLPPKPSNPFDKKAKLTYLLQVRKAVTIKNRVAEKLKALRRAPVIGTDIWGFLAKAQDLKVSDIVMFTDLGDTMRNEVSLKLNGVRVWILGFQSGRNPKEAAKRRAYWTEIFRRAGAAEITFHDISQPLPRLERKGGES